MSEEKTEDKEFETLLRRLTTNAENDDELRKCLKGKACEIETNDHVTTVTIKNITESFLIVSVPVNGNRKKEEIEIWLIGKIKKIRPLSEAAVKLRVSSS